MFEQITSNIFQVGGDSLSHHTDAAVYLVKGADSSLLIDAGTGRGTDILLKNIRSAGVSPETIKYLFLTHCHYDHSGGAADIRSACGCGIVCHSHDAAYLERGDPEVTAASWYRAEILPLSIDIQPEETHTSFSADELEIDYIHTPGHSPGSSVLLMSSDGLTVLFGQDIHGPLNEVLLSDRELYLKSLEYLITLNADILCEGHFGIIKGRDRVRDFIESYL